MADKDPFGELPPEFLAPPQTPQDEDPGPEAPPAWDYAEEGVHAKIKGREQGPSISAVDAGASVTDIWPRDFLDSIETAAEFCARDKPRSRTLLGPMLAEGQRMMVVAQTGHGKTTFILRMVAAAIRGQAFIGDWEGLEGGGGRALFLDLEQDERTAELRLTEAGLDTATDIDYRVVADGFNLRRDERSRRALEALLRERDYTVVVLDPLFKAFVGEDSNDEATAGACMAVLDRLRMEYRFALVMGMHARKPTPKVRFGMADAFGSTAWTRGAETVLGVERPGPGVTRLSNLKDRVGMGDLVTPAFPVDARLMLSYSREHGFEFRHDQQQRSPSLDRMILALEGEPDGLTVSEFCTRTGFGERTVADNCRKYLEAAPTRGPNGQKRWRLPIDEDTERWEAMADAND